MFKLKSKFRPTGSQPEAIKKLVAGLKAGRHDQVLLGVTGSGKTFSVANVIAQTQKPTLVIAHNKTLAAQLTQEFRSFFPDASVEYFVSYYDYYQPEAYLPNSDTYIEKEATINDEIDRLRNAATQGIISREAVIVVASVSCIYGLGSPEYYAGNVLEVEIGQRISREDLMRLLLRLQFTRSEADQLRGTFRVRGGAVEVVPADKEIIFQLKFAEDKIVSLCVLHRVNRSVIEKPEKLSIFPAKHYLVPENIRQQALKEIAHDLEVRLKHFRAHGKILEAERLSRKTNYDLEMIKEIGYCNGIENYSRYFEARPAGSPPFTLLDYFQKRFGKDYLLVIDESHVTVPQIGGMYEGDKSRKDALIEYGFRLPSARDNRPLKFDEFTCRAPATIYTSATPAKYEVEKAGGRVVEQVVRPTGLVDPEAVVRPTASQIDDLTVEIEQRIKVGERVLVTTLTKKMAEDLSEFLREREIKVRYLHSDVATLERITILTELRQGKFDVLVGVNLLREGLDLPEVSLVAILDADKEGFLRSETSLVQTIGRAARNVNGKVILYADNITGSMKRALDETARRRKIQLEYNRRYHITPKTIEKEIKSIAPVTPPPDVIDEMVSEKDFPELIRMKEKEMKLAAQELRFEEAAILRDQTIQLKKAAGIFKKVR